MDGEWIAPPVWDPGEGRTTEQDVQTILQLAAEEGLELSVWGGRLAYRGASAKLLPMLRYHEEGVVTALGGRFISELDWPDPPRPPLRFAGRHARELW